MIILAFDPSTKTGWVALEWSKHMPFNKYEVLGFGTINVSKLRGLSRLEAVYNQVQAIYSEMCPDVMAIEGYAHGQFSSVTAMVEVGTMLRFALRDTVPFVEVSPTSIKKFVSGSGTSSKNKIMLEVYKQWAFEGSDDECDAFGLAMFLSAFYFHKDMKINKTSLAALSKWRTDNPDEEKRLQLIAKTF